MRQTCQNHPDRPAAARGMCITCYTRDRRRRLAGASFVGRRPTGRNDAIALRCVDDWLDAFWAKVDTSCEGGCHEWQAGCNNAGYGIFHVADATLLAHRLSYALATGQTDAQVVMHVCDNPKCVNPAHLRGGSYADNMADMDAKGRRNVTPKVGAHLRDRVSHPRAKAVVGPAGRFASATLAAERVGVNDRTMRAWCGAGLHGWSYV